MNNIIVTQEQFVFKVKFKVQGSSDDFQEMLSDFKSSILNRKWNPVEKVWEVPNIYGDMLKDWCIGSGWWQTIEWCGQLFDGYGKPFDEYKKSASASDKASSKTSYQKKQKTSYQNESQNTSYQKSSQTSSADDFEDFVDLDPVRGKRENWYNTLYLTSDAQMSLVEKVWNALMLMYHPDKGGDAEKATAINAAYQKIKESLKK